MLYIKDITQKFITKGDLVVFCTNNNLKTGVVTKVCPEKVAIKYAKGMREHETYVKHSNVVKWED